jgi:hypothetical protein
VVPIPIAFNSFRLFVINRLETFKLIYLKSNKKKFLQRIRNVFQKKETSIDEDLTTDTTFSETASDSKDIELININKKFFQLKYFISNEFFLKIFFLCTVFLLVVFLFYSFMLYEYVWLLKGCPIQIPTIGTISSKKK